MHIRHFGVNLALPCANACSRLSFMHEIFIGIGHSMSLIWTSFRSLAGVG